KLVRLKGVQCPKSRKVLPRKERRSGGRSKHLNRLSPNCLNVSRVFKLSRWRTSTGFIHPPTSKIWISKPTSPSPANFLTHAAFTQQGIAANFGPCANLPASARLKKQTRDLSTCLNRDRLDCPSLMTYQP